ncbi:acyl-CoA thioesterase [Sphingomonas sp. FW199]|uniref:acyl-CoA thioesterase n=1 Tax=Sphingomonas sp. FW199 TaxID=3400217 RepID=UPI003CE833C5
MADRDLTRPPPGEPALRVTTMPADANPYGDIFGGWLMSVMDMAAGLVAARRAKGRAVTIAVDAMQFHRPVGVGDEVSVYADLIKVGRTSLTIQVESWCRDRHGEQLCKVTEARFVFVAIDEHRKPRVIGE